MKFSKYEATGNDFIMLDRTSGGDPVTPGLASALCDRHAGVGADGVIEIWPSKRCDLRMRIVNADGSEAEMCGNGVRALLLFAMDSGAVETESATIETAAGPRTASAHPDGRISVGMGKPDLLRGSIPVTGPASETAVDVTVPLEGRELIATCVSMGNPHCVFFIDGDPAAYPVETVGPLVESHPMFPARTNVEFASIAGPSRVIARVWERGVGETRACGTGACAVAVAASVKGLAGREVSVSLPGGVLEVAWGDDGVILTGGARRVFDGETVT